MSRFLCALLVFSLLSATLSAQSKVAQAVVNGKSVQLLPSSPSNVVGIGSVTTYFSTYNGQNGPFLIDSRGNIVSGEVRPRAGSTGLFEGAYFSQTPVAAVDHGSFAIPFPTTDSDGDGTYDSIQFDKAGNFTGSGSGFSTNSGIPFSISIQFFRGAGSATGTYTATTVNSSGGSSIINGSYALLGYQGTISYTRGATNTMTLALTSRIEGVTFTGSTPYTITSADSLSYPAFTVRASTGNTYSVKAGSFSRSGNVYRGTLSLVDGIVETYWPDFVDYSINVTDSNDANGNGVPDLTDPTAGPPTITAQPVSVSVKVGGSATFSVTATGATGYQWTRQGTAIVGATQSSLVLLNVQLADSGTYTVVVSNAAGSISSTGALLTVTTASVPPVITSPPASLTISPNSTAVFSVTATGATGYQWRKDGVAIIGATGSVLVLSTAKPTQSGAYSCTVSNAFGSLLSTSAFLAFSTNPDFGRIINLSILTDVTAANPGFTVGTAVGGAGTSGTKPLVIRAAGPSLVPFGVGNVLPDPNLSLFSGSQVIASNDNWGGSGSLASAMTQVGAFAYSGPTSKDSAIAPQLSPGAYTVQIADTAGGTGNVIAELYDATPGASFSATTPRLINVSVLKGIAPAGILTAGFVIGGTTAKTILVRGMGPSLVPFGVNGHMADPQLVLYSGQTVIASNDNWGGDAQLVAANSAVGAFAPVSATSKDAIIFISLVPGSYTVQASGVGFAGGIALIEVYEVP